MQKGPRYFLREWYQSVVDNKPDSFIEHCFCETTQEKQYALAVHRAWANLIIFRRAVEFRFGAEGWQALLTSMASKGSLTFDSMPSTSDWISDVELGTRGDEFVFRIPPSQFPYFFVRKDLQWLWNVKKGNSFTADLSVGERFFSVLAFGAEQGLAGLDQSNTTIDDLALAVQMVLKTEFGSIGLFGTSQTSEQRESSSPK